MFQLLSRIFFILIFFILMALPAAAKEEMPLLVDRGSVSETVYCQVQTVGSVTYVPAREISRAVGLPLYWYQDTGSVAWAVYQQNVYITPGLDRVFLAGPETKEIQYPAVSFITNNQVYVPLRMLELAGIPVSYDIKQGVKTVSPPADLSRKPRLPADMGYLLVKDKIIARLAEKPKEIGAYSTYFNQGYKSRTHNLKLAASALDGCRVLPGGEFSFNQTVGPRVPERGFQIAIVFANKEKVEGYGGGICQVSTTLYNAVLAAGLPVVERHPHSLPVTYVTQGRDATVSYGIQDFRFRNSTKSVIIIRTDVKGSKLTIRLLKEPAFLPAKKPGA